LQHAVVNAALGASPDSCEPEDVYNMSGEFDLISDQLCIMPHIDTYPLATDFTGPNFAVSEYQPTMVDPVSAHVPLKLKKIKYGRESLLTFPSCSSQRGKSTAILNRKAKLSCAMASCVWLSPRMRPI
jgi:hypothetical protein